MFSILRSFAASLSKDTRVVYPPLYYTSASSASLLSSTTTTIVIVNGERSEKHQEKFPEAEEIEEGRTAQQCGPCFGARDWTIGHEGVRQYISAALHEFTEWLLGRFQ